MPDLLSELLTRCRAGEGAAVAELVRRFQPWAIDFATALLHGDLHGAEDAVQSAYIHALGRLHELRDPNAFAGWFRQILRTETRRITRRRRGTSGLEIRDGTAAQPTPADIAEFDERALTVRAAIASLPPRTRQAAALHYLDELAIREVAERLSVPTGTVKRRLHDARAKLRDKLKNELPL